MCQLIILYLRPDSRYILSNGRNTYGELMGKGVVPSSISHCHPAGSGGKRVLALSLRANGWLGPGLPTKEGKRSYNIQNESINKMGKE